MWKNRVVALTEEAPDQLLANPRNPRRHPGRQRDVMRDVLNDVGFVAPVIVNDLTGFLVDGHLRVEEALTAGTRTIPVIHVELSDGEEAEVVATLDPITALARYDADRLEELLADVVTDSEAINELLADLTKSAVTVDAAPPTELSSDLPDVRTLVLVLDEGQWGELMGVLRHVPGDTSVAKILHLARNWKETG